MSLASSIGGPFAGQWPTGSAVTVQSNIGAHHTRPAALRAPKGVSNKLRSHVSHAYGTSFSAERIPSKSKSTSTRSSTSRFVGAAPGVAIIGAMQLRRRCQRIKSRQLVQTMATNPLDNGSGKGARDLVKKLWKETGFPKKTDDATQRREREAVWAASFEPNAEIEDTFYSQEDLFAGPLNVGLVKYLENKSQVDTFVIDDISDGAQACGFTWHLEETDGSVGLRGTTFISLSKAGKINYLREIAESIYKPGQLTVEFLKVVGGDNVQPISAYTKRTPQGAQQVVEYLWKEVNQGGAEPEEALKFFAEECIYEDFNYEEPLRGKAEVRAFLEEFQEIKSLRFVPERFSDGQQACCFTWHVEIAGLPSDGPEIRGISYYRLNDDGLISFVRDIAESAIKPPPLQALAAFLRPRLRTFLPNETVPPSTPADRDCSCGADGVANVVGTKISASQVRVTVKHVEDDDREAQVRSLLAQNFSLRMSNPT